MGDGMTMNTPLPGSMKILHRYTGEMIFGCDAATVKQAVEAAARGSEFGAALRRADLRHADLQNANMAGLHLGAADLRDVDARGANFQGCNLSGVDFRGAYLSGASFGGAYLAMTTGLIDGGQDIRGRRFVGHWPDPRKAYVIIATGGGSGARNRFFTLAEAKAHWGSAHPGEPKYAADCMARVALIESIAKAYDQLEPLADLWLADGEKPDEHPPERIAA